MENITGMMHGKAMWKHGIGEIVKDSRCTAPGPQRGGLTPCSMNPQLQWPTCWHTLGYGLNGHKTQSFMKNGGQQKCLDKVLT